MVSALLWNDSEIHLQHIENPCEIIPDFLWECLQNPSKILPEQEQQIYYNSEMVQEYMNWYDNASGMSPELFWDDLNHLKKVVISVFFWKNSRINLIQFTNSGVASKYF